MPLGEERKSEEYMKCQAAKIHMWGAMSVIGYGETSDKYQSYPSETGWFLADNSCSATDTVYPACSSHEHNSRLLLMCCIAWTIKSLARCAGVSFKSFLSLLQQRALGKL